ncbi:MAG: DUF5811 family protein [Haloferacaceae archaeon]|jgi:hypothetical protein
MNGNNPYAGRPGTVDAGRSGESSLSPDEVRHLRQAIAGIADRTRAYLPDEYAVGADVSAGARGVEATVAVHPPAGDPVSAGLTPDRATIAEGIGNEDREEVARGLAASAALQVMSAVGDEITPTAR